jgi:hypothetical protein
MKLVINIIILLFLLSCGDTTEQQQNKGLFYSYLSETFDKEIDQTYFIIIGKEVCSLCEGGTFNGFKEQQTHINASKITLITDFKKEDIDTLLMGSFKPQILIDSNSNFSSYTFPRSYITIYKVKEGEIINHAFFSESEELNQFLEKEGLKK